MRGSGGRTVEESFSEVGGGREPREGVRYLFSSGKPALCGWTVRVI